MKNNDEMYQSLLSRFDEYQEKKKKRMLIIKRFVPVIACLCIATVLGFGHWDRFAKRPDPSANSDIVEILTTAATTADISVTVTTDTAVTSSSAVSASVTKTTVTGSTTSAGTAAATSATHTRSVTSTSADTRTTASNARRTGTTAAATTQPVTYTTTDIQTTAATGIAIATTSNDPYHGKPQSSTSPIVTATTTEPSYGPGAPVIFPTIRLYSTYTADEQDYTEMELGQPIEIPTDYGPALSSPSGTGILLKIDSSSFTVSLSAEKGEFRTWDTDKGSGPVAAVGKTYYIGNSGYVFWTSGQSVSSDDYESTIWIKGYLGAQYENIARITVKKKDDRTFSAVLNGP